MFVLFVIDMGVASRVCIESRRLVWVSRAEIFTVLFPKTVMFYSNLSSRNMLDCSLSVSSLDPLSDCSNFVCVSSFFRVLDQAFHRRSSHHRWKRRSVS